VTNPPSNISLEHLPHSLRQTFRLQKVTMTGIQQNLNAVSAQLNVAQVNAADPSTFAYIYPQYGGSWAPMMPGGVSALSWAYFEASSFISTLGMPEYTLPPNPPATWTSAAGADGSLFSALKPTCPSPFWVGVGGFVSGLVDGMAMVANAATFHQINPLDSYVGNLVEVNGGAYSWANGFAHVGVYARYAAAGAWAWTAAGLPTWSVGLGTSPAGRSTVVFGVGGGWGSSLGSATTWYYVPAVNTWIIGASSEIMAGAW